MVWNRVWVWELLDDESFTGCVGVFQGHDICFSELLNTILGVFFFYGHGVVIISHRHVGRCIVRTVYEASRRHFVFTFSTTCVIRKQLDKI